jgi:hypothetical protein
MIFVRREGGGRYSILYQPEIQVRSERQWWVWRIQFASGEWRGSSYLRPLVSPKGSDISYGEIWLG